jgi:hypothetical protein
VPEHRGLVTIGESTGSYCRISRWTKWTTRVHISTYEALGVSIVCRYLFALSAAIMGMRILLPTD